MSKKPYLDFLKEDWRLCILRTLADVKGSCNDSVLHSALKALGHLKLTRDDVREQIAFLKDRGLVKDEWVGDIQIVHITKRGADVAEGNVEVEGIKPPSLGG